MSSLVRLTTRSKKNGFVYILMSLSLLSGITVSRRAEKLGNGLWNMASVLLPIFIHNLQVFAIGLVSRQVVFMI